MSNFRIYRKAINMPRKEHKYIDIDGVLLDTDPVLFHEWRKNPDRHLLPEIEKIKYMQNQNWYNILRESEVIDDGINRIKETDPEDCSLMTTIYSLENEGFNKVKFFREAGIKNDIILVPYGIAKADMVLAEGNKLVDNSLCNLDPWDEKGGIPIFFDRGNTGIDNFQKYNTKGYESVSSLEKILK